MRAAPGLGISQVLPVLDIRTGGGTFLNPHLFEQCRHIFLIICFQYFVETSTASLLEQSLDRTPLTVTPYQGIALIQLHFGIFRMNC